MSTGYYGRQRHSHHAQYSSVDEDSRSRSSFQQKWACTACTYENKANVLKCEMCLTSKPKNVNKKNKNHQQKHKNSYSSQSAQSPHSPNNNNNNHHHHSPQYSPQNSPLKPREIKFTTISPPNSPPYGSYNNAASTVTKTRVTPTPTEAIIPSNVTFNPKKPISKQSIFDRWMIAQIERQSGQQPAICVKNNVILTNLCRVRAPTTFHTLQRQIDEQTNAIKHANNLDAGDFTDDEEEDLSALFPPNSPRSTSNSANYSFTPDNEDNDKQSQSHSNIFNLGRSRNGNGNGHNGIINGLNGYHIEQSSDNGTWNKSLYSFAHYVQESSNDEGDQLSPLPIKNGQQNHTHFPSATYQHKKTTSNFKRSKNKKHHKHKQANSENNGYLKRTLSTDGGVYNLKKNLNTRRRKKTSKKNMSVKQLWFKAQSQLKQGRNPPILAKYNIKLVNIRQHNPRFKDYQRRKSHHEKAATYLQVNGDKLTRRRGGIDHDDDDFSDTENDFSVSSPIEPTTPSTPQNIDFDPNAYVE